MVFTGYNVMVITAIQNSRKKEQQNSELVTTQPTKHTKDTKKESEEHVFFRVFSCVSWAIELPIHQISLLVD
jgi:hypothetical protein